jgi:hypothetical protein
MCLPDVIASEPSEVLLLLLEHLSCLGHLPTPMQREMFLKVVSPVEPLNSIDFYCLSSR